jgi:hypothetical protein
VDPLPGERDAIRVRLTRLTPRARGSGSEDVYEEPADRRVRLDPLDPKTSRHGGKCEFASETDAAVLKIVLKIKDGAGGGYWWVECGTSECGWQVPHYAVA